MTNRILLHLAECECQRTARRKAVYKEIANHLDAICHPCDSPDDDAIVLSWSEDGIDVSPMFPLRTICATDLDEARDILRSELERMAAGLTYIAIRLATEGGAV